MLLTKEDINMLRIAFSQKKAIINAKDFDNLLRINPDDHWSQRLVQYKKLNNRLLPLEFGELNEDIGFTIPFAYETPENPTEKDVQKADLFIENLRKVLHDLDKWGHFELTHEPSNEEVDSKLQELSQKYFNDQFAVERVGADKSLVRK